MATAKEYVEKLDWQSAIAAATLELDPNSTQTNNPSIGQKPKNNKDEESYLYRGIARCFITDKEGKHKEAIEDLSKAIILNSNIQGANKNVAYYYRSYAFYLDGDYKKAIEDCYKINSPQKDELLGKIYLSMSNYHEASKKLHHAIRWYNQKLRISPPGLLESYRDACKRMNSV